MLVSVSGCSALSILNPFSRLPHRKEKQANQLEIGLSESQGMDFK
jgi:hypothetical protein